MGGVQCHTLQNEEAYPGDFLNFYGAQAIHSCTFTAPAQSFKH
jgi:hypothetical protein